MTAGTTPETPPATTPPRATTSRRRRWPLVLGGVLLAAVAFVALLPVLLSTGWTRDLIHSWLEENVDRTVTFSSLDVSWTEGVTLRDLVVSDDRAPDVNVLTTPEIRLDAPLFPLLAKRLDVRKLTIDDAVVHVALRDDGVNT